MRVALATFMLLLTGCSLFVDLEGLRDGSGEGDAASSTGGGSSADRGPGTGGGGPGTGGGGSLPSFFDDFERPDSGGLGNGWTEKVSDAFDLLGGEAVKMDNFDEYRDNIAYRPEAEDQRDVEVSVELRFVSQVTNDAMLFARVQRATITEYDVLDGYLLSVSATSGFATIARQRDDVPPFMLGAFPAMLGLPGVYRLRLRVSGTDPVELTGSVEEQQGSGWAVLGETTVTDSTPSRLTTPGATGFSADDNENPAYDSFGWQALASAP